MSAAIDHARDLGHAAAEACADKAGDDFREEALEAVREYAKRGGSFTTEDVRAASFAETHDGRAWGAVMLRAKRLGIVEACGAVPVVSSRGGFKTLWRATQ